MSAGGTLRLVLGDQLSHNLPSLRGVDRTCDVVLMAEVMGEATYVPHHPQKIAFLFSAMRHFAEELRARGVAVDYAALEDAGNTGSLDGELRRAIDRHQSARVELTFPGEWRVWKQMRDWQRALPIPVEVREDDRFFCSISRFRAHAKGRRQMRMEFFYREMRRDHGVLLTQEGEPEGGQWNFDAENRKRLPKGLVPPPPFRVEPDAITAEVLALVARRFGQHFGSLEGFAYAVTAADATRALDHFIRHGLADFGDYQDAMAMGQDTLFHSILSPYLNAGLLDPRAAVAAAEAAYRQGKAPLNAVEGFIRQILGWREYVRGIYWLNMPEYANSNALSAHRPLPDFYWTGETDLNCLAQVIDQTRRTAYAHHIQRLMVTGNFALLLGVEPAEIEAWYLAVYLDAYEWVELPNVHGMVMFADGGYLASKPYAASGKYIDRMSDYCRRCRYDVKQTEGPDACPFNYLYWNFIAENAGALRGNPRMATMYKGLDRMSAEKRAAVQRDAARFIAGLVPAYGDE
ncbi:cryptochrome/photolyase family protein [Niveispirillum sp. SYP-B3756]|uniref:cryptochrome/photolyase family protein n=1 Tax=Niveispirillum sp. SYP-B3756 TaxID=2662178 RepID=UPI001FFEA66F|nr:cryptochrome/photolyase family protein [Niveispirillum sp. SYP-B3756]